MELLILAAGSVGLALVALFVPQVLAVLFGAVAVFCVVVAILSAMPAKKAGGP